MLRKTLYTLMALTLSASILAAADPKGGKADKPFAATIVKVDAAKHLLVFKSKTAAGKDVEQSLPIKAGVQLPNVPPGSIFTVVEQGGQVIALQAIPKAPVAVKPAKSAGTATAKTPVAKSKATKARAPRGRWWRPTAPRLG